MLKSSEVISKTFDKLSKAELYKILALRMQVFCVEQDCPYQDMDNKDQDAIHVFYKEAKNIFAYARISAGNNNTYSIGRVVVAKTHRNKGFAKKIMQSCIAIISKKQATRIVISAQSYLTDFYQNLGFINTGKYYLEDDIPHMQMQLSIK